MCFLWCCALTAFHGSMHEFTCSPARTQQQSHRQPASAGTMSTMLRSKNFSNDAMAVGVRISSTCLFAPLQVITIRVHVGASSPTTNNVEHRTAMISFSSFFFLCVFVAMFQTPVRFRRNIATSNHRVREKW